MNTTISLTSEGFNNADSETEFLLYTEKQLFEKYGKVKEEIKWKEKIRIVAKEKCTCSAQRLKKFVFSVLPILQWIPKYNPRKLLFGDIAAGITVGIVHLPQGMAYGLLASLPAVTGLYVSFFPVLIYIILGTSKHVSIGTFAVVSLMIAQVINNHVTPCPDVGSNSTTYSSTSFNLSSTTVTYDMVTTSSASVSCEAALAKRKMQIAVALAMVCGIIQVAMSIFRLGIITIYLSEFLISGFTCGAAFHVLTSQVPKLIGITVSRHSGPLALIYTYIDIFKEIIKINWATTVVSICCIALLIAGKIINEKFHDRLPIPLPWELAIVVFSTIASYFGYFNKNHGVQIVGNIPTGIETSIPQASDIGLVFLEAIPIAIVAFAIEISLCQMFATKHSYKVDSDQELLAIGVGNIFGSFFSCFPSAASLSRSVIWDEVGAHTQITGIFSSILILIILLWIGPLFESLPQAALAAIIVVNLKGLLKQFEKIPALWRVNKLDALTWVVTWLAVILLGVSLGLGVAVAFGMFTIVLKTQTVKGSVLGVVGSGEYRDVDKYKTMNDENSNIIVFRYPAPIIYANRESFKRQVTHSLGFDPVLEASRTKKKKKETGTLVGDKIGAIPNYSAAGNSNRDPENGLPGSPGNDSNSSLDKATPKEANITNGYTAGKKIPVQRLSSDQGLMGHETDTSSKKITHFVLDMSSCPFIDNDGAKTIKAIHLSFLQLSIKFFISCPNAEIRRIITVVCEEKMPVFFVSLKKATEVARGDVVVEFDDAGDVIPTNTGDDETNL
ncbi:prestin-like [Styela clava]